MPTIILDFDETLFDTNPLRKAHYLSVRPYLKEDSEHFFKRCGDEVREARGAYYFREHLKKAVRPDKMPQAVKAYLKATKTGKKYLYEDTIKFLKRYQRDFNLVILTAGSFKFQHSKIKYSGIRRFFKKIIVTQKHKALEFSKIKKQFSPPYIFIDDRGKEIDLMKTKYPEVICYWMRRPTGRNRNKPCKKFDYKISNLKINL